MTLDTNGLEGFLDEVGNKNTNTDLKNIAPPNTATAEEEETAPDVEYEIDTKADVEDEPETKAEYDDNETADKEQRIKEEPGEDKEEPPVIEDMSKRLEAVFLKFDIKKPDDPKADAAVVNQLFAPPDLVEALLADSLFAHSFEVLNRSEEYYYDPNTNKIDTDQYARDVDNANNVVVSHPSLLAGYASAQESNTYQLRPIYIKASDWERGVRNANGQLRTISSARPQDKLKTQSEIPDTMAIEIIRSVTGGGRKTIVPLVHSGIVVTMKPPTLAEYTRLKEAITASRSNLGRQTNGLLFNATSVFHDKDILNLIFSLITSSNTIACTQEYLMSVIRQFDIPTLMLGAIAARYPDGYEFHWACIQNVDKCNYTVKSLIDLKQLFRVDNSSLTDLQKNMLTNPGATRSEDDLKKYQEEFKLFCKNTAVIDERETDDIKIQIVLGFRIPTLEEYVGEGTKWINEIQESIKTASGVTVNSAREREYIIAEKINSIILEGFLPWVETITLRDVTNNKDHVIGDMEKIAEFLRENSVNPEIHTKIRDAIMKFILDNTKTIIGIPNFQCPNCGGWQTVNNEKVDIIVPIDMYSTFFMTLQSMELRLLEK